jgi:DNA-binding response OmpR family regulator
MSNEKPILMLVEDEITHRRLFERNFDRHDMDMDLVSLENGVQAMQYLYKAVENQQASLVMVLDLKMPGMNGLQVLEAVRGDDRLKHVPVIILTTSDEEDEMGRCAELGIHSYLIKPVNFDELSLYIDQALANNKL